ncbi:MAG: hypothetical protein MK110_16885 [Fuerstiella sp.]|nr:hypothetical protein [Fuerstiella sp.]
MDFPFFQMDVAHPAWLIYASLLVLTVFFRFPRVFSVRNLDIGLILSLSTALVLASSWSSSESTAVPASERVDETSYEWSSIVLLSLSILLIVRLIFDESLTRRPRLSQNLNQAGLTFLCVPAFALLMTSVFMAEPPGGNVAAVESGKALLNRQAIGEKGTPAEDVQPAPTETLTAAVASAVAELSAGIDRASVSVDSESTSMEQTIACVLVVLAHTIIIAGFVNIGTRHFNSLQLGVSMSCLYLLLPCTAFNVHELSHVLPAACLIWAVACYRRPAIAGVLLGLACGTLFFAVFLLPLWAVFYGRRGSLKFGISLGAVGALALLAVAMTSSSTDSFIARLVHTANWTAFRLFTDQLPVSSMGVGQIFLRITLAAAFFVMLTAMTVIPRRRNLENLLANSTALVVAAQLWYPEDIGTYVLWYLPLLMLVMFRPRLDRFTAPVNENSDSATRPRPATTGIGGSLSRMTLYH